MIHILRTIICDEFEKNVGRMQWKNHLDGKPMYAMQMNFRLDSDGRSFPSAQLLLFAEGNAVGVFYRLVSGDQYGDWNHLSHHDSCWRDDGVDRFLYRFQEKITVLDWHGGIANNQWYLKREVLLPEVEMLRQVTRNFRAGK